MKTWRQRGPLLGRAARGLWSTVRGALRGCCWTGRRHARRKRIDHAHIVAAVSKAVLSEQPAVQELTHYLGNDLARPAEPLLEELARVDALTLGRDSAQVQQRSQLLERHAAVEPGALDAAAVTAWQVQVDRFFTRLHVTELPAELDRAPRDVAVNSRCGEHRELLAFRTQVSSD